MKNFEIGIYSLGDYLPDAKTGIKISEQERIEEIIAAAKLAEDVGLDVFALGESHQEHFVSQAHALILAAIARETKKIQISSAATIVSTSDPVRIYENFTTLDLLSNGRAELVGGRASRLGLFSLLGYSVADYEALFEEKFELLNILNTERVINWSGQFRAPLSDAVLYPKPLRGHFPIWRAVGGPPASAVLAGKQGVPMMLATLGGPATIFNQSVDAYRQHFQATHENLENMKVGITALFHVADTIPNALRSFYPHVNQTFINLNGRGFSKELFAESVDPRSVMLIGTPELIVEKILHQYDLYHHDRLMIQLDIGGLTFDEVKYQIETLGNVIAPKVREAIREREGRAS